MWVMLKIFALQLTMQLIKQFLKQLIQGSQTQQSQTRRVCKS